MLTTKTLLIIAAIALLVFGPDQLPQLGRMLGRSVRSLREAMDGEADDHGDDE